MIFGSIKSLTIPEGKVKKIVRNSDGVILFEQLSKTKHTNMLWRAEEYASNNTYIGADGSVGYGNNMRLSTSSPSTTYMKALTGVDTTALIPVKRGDVLRFKNCNFKVSPSNESYGTILYGFDSSKNIINAINGAAHSIPNRFPYVVENGEYVQLTLEPTQVWLDYSSSVGIGFDNLSYMILSTDGLSDKSIITINEEIVDEPITIYQFGRTRP